MTKTSKINETEIDVILSIISESFPDADFQNRDISPLIENLTARQIPSRIKKLVESGHLVDLGGTPKKYRLS